MPLYEFKCKGCGTTSVEVTYGVVPTCEICKLAMGRKYSFYVEKSFVPHFNPSVGKYVRNQSEFNSELRRLSDAQTERTGIPHNYVAREQGDVDAFGATEEGMDDFHRQHYNNPITESLL